MKAIADTGFIVAFGNGNDRHHVWAVELARRITEPLLTCEAVLAGCLLLKMTCCGIAAATWRSCATLLAAMRTAIPTSLIYA